MRMVLEELLRVKNIGKSYGEQRVLKNISFSVHAGECLTLMGINGAGKTTLCEILQGLSQPDEGEVFVLGLDLFQKKNRHKILSNIGVVLQETQLYKRFTVEETLELFASFYPQVPPWDDLLAVLGLESKRRALLKHLSGGQRQKVYLACALLHRPRLLLWDEPTTGLDPQSQEQVWELLGLLKSQGHAALLTTHNLEEAEHLSDRLAIIEGGCILADGALDVLIPRFVEHSVLKLRVDSFELAADQVQQAFEGLLEDLRGLSCLAQVHCEQPLMCEMKVQGEVVLWAEVMGMVARRGFYPLHFSLQRGCLRDVYRHLTGKVL